jgi:hypothetical protein
LLYFYPVREFNLNNINKKRVDIVVVVVVLDTALTLGLL